MINYETHYRIDGNVLYSFDNKSYPLIPFESNLHADLSRVLQDPEQADVIHQCYAKHIAPTNLCEADRKSFSQALLKVCQLFGCPTCSPLDALRLALEEENNTWVRNTCHEAILGRFIEEANERLQSRMLPEKERNQKKVLIITTSASGGCEAVAKTMKAFLEGCEARFEVTLLDTEEIAKDHDPLKFAVGVTFDSLYHKIVQQANQMVEGFRQQRACEQAVSHYIRPTQGAVIKAKIRSEKPFFLFSTCQYRSQEVAYAYSLGIPIRMIHCDYGVESPQVMDLFGKVHPQLVKWWFPTLEPYIFTSYAERVGKVTLFDNATGHKLFELIDSVAKVAPGTIKEQIEQFGYPVSEAIYPITDGREMARLKIKWDIRADEKVVVIEMGKYGVGILENIFQTLLTSPQHTLPLKYLFICGHNETLQEKFIRQLKDCKNTALHSSSVYGFLPLDQMNEVRNLATLSCSKLGGASTAEYIKLGKPILVLFTHPWEKGNRVKLQCLDLYYGVGSVPLHQRVEQCIQEISTKETPQAEEAAFEWKNVLIKTLVHND